MMRQVRRARRLRRARKQVEWTRARMAQGWYRERAWIPVAMHRVLDERAKHLGMTRHNIAAAALIYGIPRVPVSEIIKQTQRWQEHVLPIASTRFRKGPKPPRDTVTGRLLPYPKAEASAHG